jgi:hypothetical protein
MNGRSTDTLSNVYDQERDNQISNPDASMRGMVHLRQGIKQSKGSTV